MASGLHIWSQTAADNGNADVNVNFAEGQAPSSVNDSARQVMAKIAEYRDDTAGSLTTGGTSTAYTLSANATFASLSELDGQCVVFKAHTTSGASPTLNVDSLGAKALHAIGGTALPTGALLANGIYAVTYDNSNSRFVVHGYFPPSLATPVGSSVDYWGTTAPNGWLFCAGQAISRTTYSALFTALGTTYGEGDGSTTFNLPDCQGRVVAGKDDMSGTSANRLTDQSGGLDGDTLGDTGGSETHTLTEAQLASHTHTGTTASNGAHTHTVGPLNEGVVVSTDGIAQNGYYRNSDTLTTSSGGAHTHTFTSNSTGSGSAHNNVQPTIIANKIIYTGVYS